MNSIAKQIFTVFALLAWQAAVSGAAQAQQPRSLSDCRAIEGELARFACYESLEDGGATTGAEQVAPAAATPPPRPVSNLPTVRRPNTDIGDLTGQSAQQQAPAATAQREEEKPGLLRRFLPFGGGSSDDEPAAATVEAAPQTAPGNDAAVDSFGRRGQAQVKTNENGEQELVDTVAGIKAIRQNQIDVTLESGQVWRQVSAKHYPLRVGDSVVIRPTKWGVDYRLSTDRLPGFIQVKRL